MGLVLVLLLLLYGKGKGFVVEAKILRLIEVKIRSGVDTDRHDDRESSGTS